jgi:hypothetical protein
MEFQPCRQIENIGGPPFSLFENEEAHVTAPQQVLDGWLAEDDEDWPRIESIRFY